MSYPTDMSPKLTEDDLIRIGYEAGQGLSCKEADAARLVGEVRRLRKEVERLRQALRDWGEHAIGCPMWYREAEMERNGWSAEMIANRDCDCGLEGDLAEP